MKILLISESFFGYADRLRSAFEKEGHSVKLISTFSPNFLQRFIKKIFNIPFNQEKYNAKILNFKKDFDVLLIINGKDLPHSFLLNLEQKLGKIKKLLYIWDDIKNLNQTQNFFDFFDKTYSYSIFDAEENANIEYLPFFYTHEIVATEKKIDLAFVGTLHTDRYSKLKSLENANPKLSFFNYIFADFMTYLKFFKQVNFNNIKFKPLAYTGYIQVLAESKAVIELPHPNQKNITTRAIEVLGTQTKLVTTSVAVKSYDFYSEENIFILNNENAAKLTDWLQKPYKNYPQRLLEKYQVETWISKILNT